MTPQRARCRSSGNGVSPDPNIHMMVPSHRHFPRMERSVLEIKIDLLRCMPWKISRVTLGNHHSIASTFPIRLEGQGELPSLESEARTSGQRRLPAASTRSVPHSRRGRRSPTRPGRRCSCAGACQRMHLQGTVQALEAKDQSTLPPEALAMIRYHSFYPWHSAGAYHELMDDHDHAMLAAVKAFNPYDLYSKSDDIPSAEALKVS